MVVKSEDNIVVLSANLTTLDGRDPHQIYAVCSRQNQIYKRERLQKYRQKAGRFADENFILNLARGAGKFDAKK